MWSLATKISTKGLEARAGAVFDVLNEYKVFGTMEGARLLEKRIFKKAVTTHAVSPKNHTYLERRYLSSGVRLIMHTAIFAGDADFREITVYPHPDNKNEGMDYEALNRDIQTALSEFKAW